MSVFAKDLIWNDIRHIEMIIELADHYGLEHHPFRAALSRLKGKYENDLIENEVRTDG